MSSVRAVTSFSADRALVPSDGIVVGGTWLLNEFLYQVANEPGGQLAIAVPYVDKGVAELSGSWIEMNHEEIDLTVVTGETDAQKAWAELRKYPWRSILICHRRDLHAKLYSFVLGNGHGNCLIGSHNLTVRGLQGNVEAGVLFRSTPVHPEMQIVILACHRQVLDLAAQSKVFVDTNKWPNLFETELTGECHG